VLQLQYSDLSFLPWEEAYALLLRLWEAKEDFDLSLTLRVLYQPEWRPGR
jgi:hypothetical protein